MRPKLSYVALIAVAAGCLPLVAARTHATGVPPAAAPQPFRPVPPAPPVMPDGIRPPMLTVVVDGKQVNLAIVRARVDVTIDGPLAQTSLTLTFRNDTGRVLEGNLDFPLPENAVLSGYALDSSDGRMMTAVPVEKNQARQIFETEERHGVDPGLLEQSVGNNFSTRIYPLRPQGARTIRMDYMADLQSAGQDLIYTVPLRWNCVIPDADFHISVAQDPVAPELQFAGTDSVLPEAPIGGGLFRAPSHYALEKHFSDIRFNSDLVLRLPGLAARAEAAVESFSRAPNYDLPVGRSATVAAPESFIAISDAPPAAPTAPLSGFGTPNPHIGVVWDASLSRLHSDTNHELQLLSDALRQTHHAVVDVTLLRNVAEAPRRFVIENGNAGALLTYLRSVPDDGGTDLSALHLTRGSAAFPICCYLLFSDGIDTLGGDPPTRAQAPVYAVTTSPQANHALLRRLAEESGGAYLNLAAMNDRDAEAAMGRTPYDLLGVAVTDGLVSDIFPDHPQPVQGRATVTGVLRSSAATVTLVYGYQNLLTGRDIVTARHAFTLRRSDAVSAGGIVARYWAHRKADSLALSGDKTHDAVLGLAHDFNIVTPTTSLLVLETLDQYVQYGIAPSADRPELLSAWLALHKQHLAADKQAQANKLNYVLNLWNEKVAWYDHPPKTSNLPNFITQRNVGNTADPGQQFDGGGLGRRRSVATASPAAPAPISASPPAPSHAIAINSPEYVRVQMRGANAPTAAVAPAPSAGRPGAAPASASSSTNRVGNRNLGTYGAVSQNSNTIMAKGSASHLVDSGAYVAYNSGASNDAQHHSAAVTPFAEAHGAVPGQNAPMAAGGGGGGVVAGGWQVTSEEDSVPRAGGGFLPVDVAMRNTHVGAGYMRSGDAEQVGRDSLGIPAAVTIKPWSPQTPYLAAMRAAGPANAYSTYLAQRKSGGYEESPAFYLDCAEYLIGIGQNDLGARVLTSILDLKMEQPSLVRIVAHRLTQLGYHNTGIRLFEEVLRLRPEEPQSYRDLALALADRADDEAMHGSPVAAADDNRALSLLNDIVLKTWDNRFPEIETIALMEANRIAARAHAVPALAARLVDPIDPRLIRNLPCDLRIVLTWNTDETDQDLWVTEPTGEKCYYAFNRTAIGGRLSHDFTQGYGPEEYLLRNSIHGKYLIQTNYFGQHSPELDGGTTVQATVITNWGRPTEKRQYLTVRMNQAKDVVDIGSVVR